MNGGKESDKGDKDAAGSSSKRLRIGLIALFITVIIVAVVVVVVMTGGGDDGEKVVEI